MTKVLVVEDELIVAEAIARVLDDAGYEVVGTVGNAAGALKEAARRRPDLVLMDIRLADGGDGIDTARKMKAERQVDVVFMSAHHDPKTRARAAAVHPAGFVAKPFSPKQLLSAVTTCRRGR
jgi:two-component system, response regulator PdtaR